MEHSRRIVIVCYSYPPAVTPRAFRWQAIAEAWASAGVEVDVICAPAPDVISPDRQGVGKVSIAEPDIIRGVRVHRVQDPVTRYGARQLIGSGTGRGEAARQRFIGLPRAAIGHAARRVWKATYWPDYAYLWYCAAARCTKALFEACSDRALITVSLPFTDHLLGLAIKGRYPHVVWLLDVGDPFAFLDRTPNNNHTLYKRLNYRVERWILNTADGLSVTTDATLDRYRSVFSGTSALQRAAVIPPLLSLPSVTPSQNMLGGTSETIHLVYVGTLYRVIRSPEFLLRILTQMQSTPLGNRVHLHFVGSINDCRPLFEQLSPSLHQRVTLHGVVDRASAVSMMRQANILVNIGNETAYQLPSKVVEYIACGKPILNLVRSEDDASIALFARQQASASFVERPGGLTPAEIERLEVLCTTPALPEGLCAAPAAFELPSILGQYEALITPSS